MGQGPIRRTHPTEQGTATTTQFTSHTLDTAPDAAKPISEGVKAAFGFVPIL